MAAEGSGCSSYHSNCASRTNSCRSLLARSARRKLSHQRRNFIRRAVRNARPEAVPMAGTAVSATAAKPRRSLKSPHAKMFRKDTKLPNSSSMFKNFNIIGVG